MDEIEYYRDYCQRINQSLNQIDLERLRLIADCLWEAMGSKRRVFLCGNGGSAANAMHIANDLIYGISKKSDVAVRVHALTANQSILTCIANDISYEEIFSYQLEALAEKDDVLIALSGSGNSPNIVKAIRTAKTIGMKTFAILGYDGGQCLALADTAVHIPVNDMQVAEDMQLIVGHMIMQWLGKRKLSRGCL